MAIRIGEYILAGELRNTRRNGVFGWLEFAPDYGIRIELTGNLTPPLAGKHLRFSVNRDSQSNQLQPDDLPEIVDSLADRQIGVVGEVQLRRVEIPDLPLEQFLELSPAQKKDHLEEKTSLYLEWFSQNGRVVAEIIDPQLEYMEIQEEDPSEESPDIEVLEEGSYGVGFTEVRVDENGVTHSEHFDIQEEEEEGESEEEDPYGLFGNDLAEKVAESLGVDVTEPNENGHDSSENSGERVWDESVDPATRAMYEQWDEIFEGKKDEPVAYLFEKPLKLPKPERVTNEDEAENYVKAILAQLALLSVALDVCEHFSALDTYRLLMNEILPTAKVHPNLAASEMVQHYSTSDFCPACESEFDAEYEANQGDDPEGGEPEENRDD